MIDRLLTCTPNNDDPTHARVAVVMEDGSLVELSNSMTKQLFRGIDELIGEDELKHGMLLNLLMLACVHACMRACLSACTITIGFYCNACRSG